MKIVWHLEMAGLDENSADDALRIDVVRQRPADLVEGKNLPTFDTDEAKAAFFRKRLSDKFG